jgi:hypothetical protein
VVDLLRERRRIGVIGNDHLCLNESGEDSEHQHLKGKVLGAHHDLHSELRIDFPDLAQPICFFPLAIEEKRKIKVNSLRDAKLVFRGSVQIAENSSVFIALT